MTKPWLYLMIATVLEIGWMISLKFTHGFTRLVPSICYAVLGWCSAYFLSLSFKTISIGTAYAIWMGTAIVGATIFGIIYFKDPYRKLRILCIMLIVLGILGLRIFENH